MSIRQAVFCVRFVSVLLAVVAIGGSGAAVAAQIPFGPQQIVSTSQGFGLEVVSGDLDGDGDLDLVGSGGTNSGSGVYWYENLDGKGTYAPARAIGAGELENRCSIQLVDMDQDGDLDLLSGWFYLAAWYPNDGHGNFGARVVIRDETFSGAGYDDFKAADLDGDGDLDVIGLSGEAFGPVDKLVWFRNNGGGSFNPATENFIDALVNENGPGHVSPADMDGDGDIDLVATQTAPFGGDNRVVWYRNTDGAGTFSAKLTISTATQLPFDVAVADIDRDGDLDVVSVDYGFNAARWHENTAGDGSAWTDHMIATSGCISYFVEIADLDQDGDPDVLLSDRTADQVRWVENTAGNGSAWTNRLIQGGLSTPGRAIAADLDGDGDLDVATASLFDNKFAWTENRTIHRNAVFPARSTIDAGADGAYWVVAADVDGDGDLDAVSASLLDNKIAWYENNGAVPPSWTARTISTAAAGARSVFAADVDGDGDVDVLSASQSDNKIAWYENDGATPPSWTARTISSTAAFATSVFAADVDGDGDMDVLSSSLSDSKIAWYENDGASPPSWTARTISTSATFAEAVFAADVDGDGDIDALSASLLDDKIAWYENDGGSPPAWTARTITTAADGADAVYAADLDGDGDLDVFSASLNDDRLAWYESNGASPPVWTPHTIATAFDGPQSISAADVDGDGDLDVLAGAYNANQIVWFENNGATPPVFTPHTISTAALSPSSVFAADMDRDGRLDVLASSATDDTIAWFKNLGGQYGFTGSILASSPAYDGEVTPLVAVGAQLFGRPGDSVGRLATLDVRFQTSGGVALTSGEANALFDELRIYRDEGNGAFEAGQDILVTTVGTLALTPAGVQTVTLPAGDPNVSVAAPATFFAVAPMTPNASSQSVNAFKVAHLAVSGSTMVDASSGIALSGASTTDPASGTIATRPRFVVNSTGDGVDAVPGDGFCATGGGACTLRAAVMESNAFAGSDRIVLGAGTYSLSIAGTGEELAATGDLDVTGALTIAGAGAAATILSGGGLDRLFDVRAGGNLVLDGLQLRDGFLSGAPNPGGAIRTVSTGTLTVRRCDLRNNQANVAGAIENNGTTLVEDSLIYGNTGFQCEAFQNSAGAATLRNVTISGNTGVNAVVGLFAGTLTVDGCTISGNGAEGLENFGGATFQVHDTLVAGNSLGLEGSFTSQGYNLIDNVGTGTGFTDGVNNDKVGGGANPVIDAKLKVLGDYGGPTLTHRLLATSPAIDAGSCGALTADQRGVKRPIDVAGVANVGDGCDIGAYELESGATLSRVEVPVRWCGLHGSPSIENPSLMGASNVNDLLRRRHEAATDSIWAPQSGIVFRSAANFVVTNYPLLEDPDCTLVSPGNYSCARGVRGDVYIDPATANFDEYEELIAACRTAWNALDPNIEGVTAVQINHFVDAAGTPLSILGIGGRAQEGDAREQAEAGRVAVVDHFYRQNVPGNPTPPNPSDTIDRLLGHELGHAVSLRHGDGIDNDNNGVIDDNDEAVVGLPRFDGNNIMQYRSGSELTAGQSTQARNHIAATIPDVRVQPISDASPQSVPIDARNIRILDFGFDGVLDLANIRILDFKNLNILDFENNGVADFANLRLLDFKNLNILDFKNLNILDFGMSYSGETPAASTTLHASTAAIPWPPSLRPKTRYFFYLDVDRDDGTGAYPASKVNPGDAPNHFPGSGNFVSSPSVAQEAGVDLIAQVDLEATCSGNQCSSTSLLRIYDYDDGAGVYTLVSSTSSPSISATSVGLYTDNGGAPVDLDAAPSGITIQPVIPNSLLFAAGWGFTTPPGGGAPVPNPVRMEVLSTVGCAGNVLNDGSAASSRDCQCTSCASCPDYPGCVGTTGVPQTLTGTTILTDDKLGELTFQPPVLPVCTVIPALASQGQAVTVFVSQLPTNLTGTVEAARGTSVIGTAPTSSISPAGSVSVSATLPSTALGQVTLSAGITSYAPRAQCLVTVTPTVACVDTDADGACDSVDADDDNDGVADGSDSAPQNRLVCRDVDADGCDDCASGANAPALDGPDYDRDGLCDRGDPDDDNDGVPDATDGQPRNPNACGDIDHDQCDDCVIASTPSPGNDGPDAEGDGLCDFGDPDDDNDGQSDWIDCAPNNGTLRASPAEVSGVGFGTPGNKSRLTWTSPQGQGGSSTVSDVLRGTVAGLPVGSGAEACLVSGTSAAQFDDATVPASGAAQWYLLRARNACGTGSYGKNSAGVPRTSGVCP